MSKEIITTIQKGKEILHGILNEDTMTFSAIGRDKYGVFTTTMNLKGLNYKIIKNTMIDFERIN